MDMGNSQYMDNCDAVNTRKLDDILAEMKSAGECADTDCVK